MRQVELIARTPGQERIDRYLSEREHIATRAQVQKLLKAGLVLVDGKQAKPSHRLKGGERLQVAIPEPEPSTLEPEAIPLDIVYEDEFLVVVNKPPGMVVHPGGGVRKGTLVNALLAHCKDLSGIGGVVRPGIVHRLDKGTSGLIIAAKDDLTHLGLSEALKARKVKRTYETIVWGHPAKKEAIIDTLIGRSRSDRKKMAVLKRSGRQAVTSYRVVEEFEFASRLIVNLETGRTHQIRVHLAHTGHPVFGDPTYGGRRRKYGTLKRPVMERARWLLKLIDRQALHARELAFRHPRTGSRMKLAAPMAHDIKVLLHALRQGESEGGRK
jgi:23S rRNA pseudouridine1911/1915/1917 synthase